ncbi:MAG TPA: ABC transporter permease subunit [Spirochaetia bacterium]|nr:ABC transporter permease subunit [Spirochaetia bacterium]
MAESARLSEQTLLVSGTSKSLWTKIWKARLLYLILLPGFIHLLIFKLAPIFGVIISFENYSPFRGMLRSQWVGFAQFAKFFSDPYSLVLIRNTILLAFYSLAFTYVVPIVFALFLNEVRNRAVLRSVQTVSLFPYFVSAAVVISIMYTFLSPQGGLVNQFLALFGIKPIFFMAQPQWFRPLYVGVSVWQQFGYSAIIYLAAIVGVDPELYDVAEVDGAGRWRKMFNVTIPGIRHVLIVMLILSIGQILTVDVSKVLLMYNPSVYSTADILQTYVYRAVFASGGFPNYSYAAAVGLIQSIFAFLLVIASNQISKRYSESSIF